MIQTEEFEQGTLNTHFINENLENCLETSVKKAVCAKPVWN